MTRINHPDQSPRSITLVNDLFPVINDDLPPASLRSVPAFAPQSAVHAPSRPPSPKAPPPAAPPPEKAADPDTSAKGAAWPRCTPVCPCWSVLQASRDAHAREKPHPPDAG